MNVVEFVDELATKLDITREAASQVYRGMVDLIRESLAKGDEVRLDGLGKFVSRMHTAGQGRPQLKSRLDSRVIEVTFKQYNKSKTELLALCPFKEELQNVQFQAATTETKGSSDGRPANVRSKSNGDVQTPERTRDSAKKGGDTAGR